MSNSFAVVDPPSSRWLRRRPPDISVAVAGLAARAFAPDTTEGETIDMEPDPGGVERAPQGRWNPEPFFTRRTVQEGACLRMVNTTPLPDGGGAQSKE